MAASRSFTLSEIARRLEVPQHRLIHLCEKGVIVPDVHDAAGRGSSRVFSRRNVLEVAVALRLRDMMLPVAAVGAIVHVLRAFEERLGADLPHFELPDSLRDERAPDLRVIISDGQTIYFSLGTGEQKPKLFGGIPRERLEGVASIFTYSRPGSGSTARRSARCRPRRCRRASSRSAACANSRPRRACRSR